MIAPTVLFNPHIAIRTAFQAGQVQRWLVLQAISGRHSLGSTSNQSVNFGIRQADAELISQQRVLAVGTAGYTLLTLLVLHVPLHTRTTEDMSTAEPKLDM
jgi:hypothetical protein